MHYQHLRHWKPLLLALLVAGLLLPAHGTHAQAADPNIITVNSTADAPDADPADGQCAAAQLSAQACTLRAAILHANATPGTQTIELPINTYTLTIRNTGELGDAQSGDLDITDEVTIRKIAGPSSDLAWIRASEDPASGIDRVFEIHPNASATISGVSITSGRTGGDGGGVLNRGTLMLLDSSVYGNQATNGGGIQNHGTLTLDNSSVGTNNAVFGGGITNRGGQVDITRSIISHNTVSSNGAGIHNFDGGFIRLEASTISQNTTRSNGGGINNAGTLRLGESAIHNNVALGDGGGVQNSGILSLLNSTVSSNRAENGVGGGINNTVSALDLLLSNVTIAANVASRAGGLANASQGRLEIEHIIIGDNSAAGGQAPDCDGQVRSLGYNLIENPQGCGIVGDATGTIVGRDADLEPLQGEPPQAHPLRPGSPAIDAGSPDGCRSPEGALLSTDQRGTARPTGPRCDIGAFEAPSTAPLPPDARCFEQTGYCIGGRLRTFWEQNGGLAVFGYPTGPQQPESVEGRVFQVQWFERHRLELHPENARPYDVLMGRLGADLLARQGITATPEQRSDRADCRYFETTGFNVCGRFLRAWNASGLEFDGRPGKSYEESLALFGLPLTGEMTMVLSDGKQHTVQWFERARFEYHPDNPLEYQVLFGLLANEIRAGSLPSGRIGITFISDRDGDNDIYVMNADGSNQRPLNPVEALRRLVVVSTFCKQAFATVAQWELRN